MKRLHLYLMALVLGLCLGGGCSKKTAAKVDMTPVERAFQNANPAMKTAVDRALAAEKVGDYETVLRELSPLPLNAQLTADQQNAITEVLAKAQKLVAAAPPKNVTQLPMALPKR